MKNITKLHRTSAALSTPSDLSSKARQSIANTLNPLIADIFALFIKTKNFHWHVSGSHYRDYHLLLDEQSDQILAMVDVLAERVRKLGETTIHSIGQIHQLKHIEDDNENFVEPKEMMQRLLHDNQELVKQMRSAHHLCHENNDVGTTSVLEVFIDETERRIWFLYETQAE